MFHSKCSSTWHSDLYKVFKKQFVCRLKIEAKSNAALGMLLLIIPVENRISNRMSSERSRNAMFEKETQMAKYEMRGNEGRGQVTRGEIKCI